MDLKETIVLAIKQLLANKGRTFLTMLGMFIGVGSVIMILGLGQGYKNNMKDLGNKIGMGSFYVARKTADNNTLITEEDLSLIRSMPEIDTIMASTGAQGFVYDKDRKQQTINVYASGIDYLERIGKEKILEGRGFKEGDERARSNAIIIPDVFARAILKKTDYKAVIGETVELTIDDKQQQFEIIGVYETNLSQNDDEERLKRMLRYQRIYMPFSTMTQILELNEGFGYVDGIIKDGYDQKEIASKVRNLLNKRHQMRDGYEVQTIADQMDMINQMLDMITLFIGAVASISLIVGGVGIMNIMLVTVKERTREIGVRKALGATNGIILRQFLIESLMLTLIAGIIGMFIGYIGAMLIGAKFDMPAVLTFPMILFSVGTSTAIGLIFGVYPAYEAANLEPVEALRYE